MLENEYSIVKQKSSKTIYSKEKSLKTIRHDTQKQDDSFLSREMHLKNISITKFENDKDSTKNICNFKKDNGNNNSVLKSKCGMPSILDISSLNKNESIQQKSLNCFKNQSIRRKFIINIVGLVIIMLLIVSVTVSITCIPSIRKWLSSPENKLHIYGIFYITFALWVIVYLVTVCCKNFRRHFPWNVILVILNTLAISILTALLTLYVEVYLILFTVLATIIIVTIIGLLVYFQFVDITKKRHLWKLTLFSPMIFTLLIVLNLTFHQTTFLQNIILFIIILLSVMYLFIDLQMILNDERNKIGPNDTVFAVIILFTDIVHIFMSIISFFNKKYYIFFNIIIIFNEMKFVKLSNWFIKFIEGNYDDFDIVLEGIAGKNDMFLPLNSYYISTPIIYIGKYNEILCDGNILIELESSINKNKMKNMGFSLEFISCFKYGFPTNWVNITDDFYLKFKKNNDLSISHQLVEVALREMNEYKVTYLESAVNIVDWYLRIHPCENEDDFHVILKGQIKDYTNHSYNDVSCEDVICDRETFDIILCGRTQLYKLVAPINVKKMKEYGYPEELINCFKFGFPSNWFQLWLEYFNQYKNSVRNYNFSGNSINQALNESRMLRFSQFTNTSFSSDSKFFKTHQYSSNDVKKGFIELECEGMLDVESSLSSSLLSSSFVSTNDSVSPLPNIKKPIWNDLEISENIFSLKGFLTNDFLQHNSLSSSVSLVNSLDIPNDTSKLFNSSLKAEDKNKETQMTDFFALTNKFSSFSQISDSEHVAKFEGMDKTSKKIMNNNDQIINNSIDTEELFDASLDLADMENSSRGKFNIIDDSLNISITSIDDSTIKTKPLVYYIPAVKHISKPKKKSTKIKKREPVESKFNFEKLVYEEIERYKNSSLDKVYFDEDSSLKNLF